MIINKDIVIATTTAIDTATIASFILDRTTKSLLSKMTKITIEFLYGRFPIVKRISTSEGMYYIILNKFPLSQSSCDIYNRDTGIIVVHESEIPIPAPEYEVEYSCKNLIEITDKPTVYKGYMETKHKGKDISLDKYFRTVERNPRNLERIRKFLPNKPSSGSVQICKDNYCYQLAKTLGFGQVGLVVLLCDLDRPWLKRLSNEKACKSVLKIQPLGRKFYWEVSALQSLKGVVPDLIHAWACQANGEGLIIEDRTYAVKSASLSSKKVRSEGRAFLDRLHSKRWIHNDIHKGNIQRKNDGSLTFIDYGYARYYPEGERYSDFSAESTFIYGPVDWHTATSLDNVHFEICFGNDIRATSKRILRERRNSYVDRLKRFWKPEEMNKEVGKLSINLERLVCGGRYNLTKSVDGKVTSYCFEQQTNSLANDIKANIELLKP